MVMEMKKELIDSVLLMEGTKPKRSKLLAEEVSDNRRDMKGNGKETEKLRAWSELPTELLELILSHFDLRQNIGFSAICKRWHSIALLVRDVNHCPWLLTFHEAGLSEFYDPSNSMSYNTVIPELSGTWICCSRNGWLLLGHSYHNKLFFFNPFAKVRIELPEVAVATRESRWLHQYETAATFSSAPTSSSCIVFMIKKSLSKILVSTWRPGDTVWTSVPYEKDLSFEFISSNLLFCDGLVYSLSGIDTVAVCDVEKCVWSVLDVSPPILPSKMMGKVLAECSGDLLMVCICYNEEPIILKLDKVKMKWTKVNSFGGLTLFASFFSSHFTVEVPEIMRNGIYFPQFRLFGKRCISYSLDNHRYYPSRCWNDWRKEGAFGNRRGQFTWIEPPKMFQPSFDEV